MNKVLFLLLLITCVYPSGSALRSNVILEGDVIVSNALPDWGMVCVASDVRGNPRETSQVLYSVSVGERVRLHELSNADNSWVSIGAAEWMPLKNLC